jgi:hypothetical protein
VGGRHCCELVYAQDTLLPVGSERLGYWGRRSAASVEALYSLLDVVWQGRWKSAVFMDATRHAELRDVV